MVNALTFDTHQFVKDLTAVGFTDAQAETVTSLVRQAREFDLAELATKSDLQFIKGDLERFATKADLERFATKADLQQFATKADLAETKADFLKWMVGAISFQTAAILGAVAVLARAIP